MSVSRLCLRIESITEGQKQLLRQLAEQAADCFADEPSEIAETNACDETGSDAEEVDCATCISGDPFT